MNFKQLISLLIVGLILGGIGYKMYQGKRAAYRSSETGGSKKLLPDFKLNDVAHVRIQQGTNELNVVKKDAAWTVRERYDYPANYSEISELLTKMWDLKTVQSVDVGASQLGRLELATNGANGGTLLEFKNATAAKLEGVVLGKKITKESPGGSPMGGGEFPIGRYVLTQKDGKAWMVNEALANVEPKADTWLNKDFFKVEKLKAIEVMQSEATNSWKLSRETEGGELKLADVKPEEQVDATKVSGVGYALSAPSFADIVAPDVTPAVSGLDKPVVARLETFDGFTYLVKIGKPAADDNLHFQVAVDGKIVAERAPEKDEKTEDKEKLDKEHKEKVGKLEEKLKQEKGYEKWTYLVPKYTLDPLLKTRAELMADKKAEGEGNPASKGPSPFPTGGPGQPDLQELLKSFPQQPKL